MALTLFGLQALEAAAPAAGEATCNEYMGTMHGAYISGCRAADELLSKLKEQ